jgi:hypothetical protein
MIRVALPAHVRNLARVDREVEIELPAGQPATIANVLDEIERRYPMLKGTIRDHGTKRRRPFLRFFACEEDLSHQDAATPLPEPVARGAEPLLVVGAMAGG